MQPYKTSYFILALLFFSVLVYPFISVANKPAQAGIPPLFIYLFCVWLLAIGAAYFLTRKRKRLDE